MTSGKSPDVILVYPPHEMPPYRGGKYYTSIPLGMAYLAAGLAEKSRSVTVFDCNVESFQPGALAAKIMDLRPSVVGISVTSPAARYARNLILELREGGVSSGIRHYGIERSPPEGNNPQSSRGENNLSRPIITVGGPHITADPSSSTLLGADTYFTGEADYAFAEYCVGIVNGKLSGNVSADTHKILSCGQIMDLDALPFPARHLFEERKYKFTSALASRGCPYGCIYCGMAGTQCRRRGIEGLRREIELLAQSKPRSIDFADDVFTLDRKYAWDLSTMMGEIGVQWACTTRVDLVDEGLLTHMAGKGCGYVSFGIESGSQRVRHYIGKGIDDQQYVNAFKWCRDSRIRTRAYAMLGLPGETKEDIRSTIDFMRRLEPDDVMYSQTIIFPGTRLMEQAAAEGAIDKNAWANFILGKADIPVYTPPSLSAAELGGLCFEEQKKFYLSPWRIMERAKNAQSLDDLVDCLKAATAYFIQ